MIIVELDELLVLAKAVRRGLRTPFLVGDALKVALAAGLFPLAWAAVEKFTAAK